MNLIPVDRRYTEDHEWALLQNDSTIWIGVTDFAQKQLGEVVYVELPAVGSHFDRGDAIGSIESVKAVAEVYCPISGVITKNNDLVSESPEELNSNPYGAWLFEIRPDSASDFESLLDSEAYEKLLQNPE